MSEQEHIGGIGEDSISAAISRLVEHPEIIGAVASALSSATGDNNIPQTPQAVSTNTTEQKNETTAPTDPPDLAASLMPIISRLGTLDLGALKGNGGKGGVGGKHAALLCALKPYLSKNRSDAIDYMLKISQMSEIISKLR